MKLWRSFSTLLIVIFSLALPAGGAVHPLKELLHPENPPKPEAKKVEKNPVPSLKEALNKLENDLKRHESKTVIEKDVQEVLKAKSELPVFHVPELNYLTNSQVERLPSTALSFLNQLYFSIQPLERALEALLFVVVFYTFIFYFQHASVGARGRQLLTLGGVLLLSLSAIFNLKPLFYALTGLAITQALSVNKRKTALFLAGSTVALIALNAANETVLDYARCPKFLYKIKVERDGYAPPFLIEEAIKDPVKRELELRINDLSLGDLKAIEGIEELRKKVKDPKLIGIIENCEGYVAFLNGDLKGALKHFKLANSVLNSPVVMFNLYLTYSSLLNFDAAHKLKEELIKLSFPNLQATTVPLLIHLPPDPYRTEVPFFPLVALIGGVLLGAAAERVIGPKFEKIETAVLQLPGMLSYINSQLPFFLLIAGVVLIVNFLLGRLACN
jgi:tetratricopeptide (TPR) repeat protein